MELRYQTFGVHGADRQTLLVVHAAPGSRETEALARLAGLTPGLESPTSEPEPLTSVD
jgi:hypothetical protein